MDPERYASFSDEGVYEKFIDNNGNIEITDTQIKIELKKKRDLPQIIEMMEKYAELN